MEKKNTEQKIQVRFPLDVWQEIKKLARQHGRSFNGEVIWALRYYLASQKGDGDAGKKL